MEKKNFVKDEKCQVQLLEILVINKIYLKRKHIFLLSLTGLGLGGGGFGMGLGRWVSVWGEGG